MYLLLEQNCNCIIITVLHELIKYNVTLIFAIVVSTLWMERLVLPRNTGLEARFIVHPHLEMVWEMVSKPMDHRSALSCLIRCKQQQCDPSPYTAQYLAKRLRMGFLSVPADISLLVCIRSFSSPQFCQFLHCCFAEGRTDAQKNLYNLLKVILKPVPENRIEIL